MVDISCFESVPITAPDDADSLGVAGRKGVDTLLEARQGTVIQEVYREVGILLRDTGIGARLNKVVAGSVEDRHRWGRGSESNRLILPVPSAIDSCEDHHAQVVEAVEPSQLGKDDEE